MSDPRLLQDDSPEIAAQVRLAKAKSVYDDALLGTSDPEIAAKLDAQTEAYEAEQARDYGKLPPANTAVGGRAARSVWEAIDYEIRHDALKLANQDRQCFKNHEIVDIATTFEAYLRGETKIESETVA